MLAYADTEPLVPDNPLADENRRLSILAQRAEPRRRAPRARAGDADAPIVLPPDPLPTAAARRAERVRSHRRRAAARIDGVAAARPRDAGAAPRPRGDRGARALGRRARRRARPPTAADAAEAERRLDDARRARGAGAEAGRPPTADVPLLGAGARRGRRRRAPRSRRGGWSRCATCSCVARHVRAWLRRDPDRFPHLAACADGARRRRRSSRRALAHALDEQRPGARRRQPGARRRARASRASCAREIESAPRRAWCATRRIADVVGEQYVTVRNGRFVVPIRTAAAWTFDGVVQDRSRSGETVFVEPLFAVELNNRLLLASKNEEAEERRVRAELTALVRAARAALARARGRARHASTRSPRRAAFARAPRVHAPGARRRRRPPAGRAPSAPPR